MAIITSTTNNISLHSSYTCITKRIIGVNSSGQQVDQVHSFTVTDASRDSKTITFSYNPIDLNTVNMVVLQMKGTNTPFYSAIRVNEERVPVNQNIYTAYLDKNTIGATSASFTVDFISDNPHHNHYNDADSETIVGGSTNHALIEYRKQHSIPITLSEITLKIYTGNDAVAAPSAAQMFVGVDGIAKKVSEMFVGVNGKAKRVAEAWIGVNGKAKKIFPTLVVGDLFPGDILQIDEMGDGKLVDWIVMHQDYYGEKQTVLMRKYCLATSSSLDWNGGSSAYSYPYFDKYADNYLTNNWLLSTGYLTFQKLLLETVITGRYWSGGTLVTAARKVWLPSAVNLSRVEYPEGSSTYYDDPKGAFDYFEINDNNAARIAYKDSAPSTAVTWWTRTTTGGVHPYCRRIGTDGAHYNATYYSDNALRPVINISSENYIKQVSSGVYKIVV